MTASHLARAEEIAKAVLYEGYILYPYRPSSVKNRQRWTFGGVYPRAFSEAQGADAGSDTWNQQTQCLIQGGPDTLIDIHVRFLHLVTREVREYVVPEDPDSDTRVVESLRVSLVGGEKTYHTWEEAVERTVDCSDLAIQELLLGPREVGFAFPASRESETLHNAGDLAVGLLVREKRRIEGTVAVAANEVAAGLFQVTLHIMNVTPFEDANRKTRPEALVQSFISTHAILGVRGGQFVSLIDPPDEQRQAAADCKNIGTYPVLAGEEGQRDMLLSSPIILYDYPQIAPESAGDLFDGTEIDEILSLRILTLTDEEKQEMRQSDDRGRELLERTESLPPEVFMRLHGVVRGLKPAEASPWDALDVPGLDPWIPEQEGEHVALEQVTVDGVTLKKGDHVRLRPKRQADAFDMLLNGHMATIESIEQDYEGRILLAVTVDDDPGRDFGMDRKPAHRFFYGPDEVELLAEDAGANQGVGVDQ